MDENANTDPQPGQPRSEEAAEFLARFDRIMRLPIILSAILPLVIVSESASWVAGVVDFVTWLVFLFDYVVQSRHRVRYRHTRRGRFDLFIVLATAPWFLLPGAQAGRFVVVLRLARLARVVVVTRGSRRVLQRLGAVTFVAAGVMVLASLVAYRAEHPTNPEFATIGDALWWGIVTLTTVGYGDVVPITARGRWAAVTIMITGIAVLGTLAGTLASFFRGNEVASEPEPDTEPESAVLALTDEVSALRRQVEALTDILRTK